MTIENIINIKNESIEDRIEKAIKDTKDELDGLTVDTTCMIYSSYITRNLYKEHLINKLVSTTELNYSYNHQFNIVPKNKNELYLIDLTFKQFQSDNFKELLQKGYILIDIDMYMEYLDVVGNVKEDNIILSFSKKIV